MHVHFVGIGGSGMSALARLFHARQIEVSGSDAVDSAILEALRDEGMGVFVGHSRLQVAEDVAVVVYSEAIPLDNPELEAARARKIPLKTYFEALGEVTEEFETIAVAGTHGKTTTTALIARLLMQSYRDPTVVIGTQMEELDGKNMRLGGGKYMVVEACEYRRSFLHVKPKFVVLTNIELDHMDYYRDFDDYLSAFKEFVSMIPENGVLIGNGDDPNVREVAKACKGEVVFFDGDSPDLAKLDLAVPGHHNKMNALAAFTVGVQVGVEEEMMVESLNSFIGTWRRFEFKGHYNGADVYDDYAHHPTEVRATLQAAREKYPDHKLIAVFQPHQHSRARHFLKEFAAAFGGADEVVIPNIYGVRDSKADVKAISVEDFVKELQKHHDSVRNGGGLDATVAYLKGEGREAGSVGENDLVLVMGAGDVWKVAEGLVDGMNFFV